MSKEKEKNRMVPELRFPGFDEPWDFKILGQFLEGYSERVPANTELPIYSSTRNGLHPQEDYYDGRKLINTGEYGVVPKGYFVYRHMSDDTVFKFNINEVHEKIAVSKEYPVFKTVNLNSHFLLQKLNGGNDFKKFAIKQKKGGTRTRLYFKTLCSWETLLPSLEEQQKIADCLSSLDDFIGAETEKLDALKDHKKGLLQQLFPTEGETVPRLRFPEFEDDGDWEEKPLRSIGNVITGSTPKTSEPNYYNGETMFVSPVDITEGRYVTQTKTTLSELGFSKTRPIRENSILFVCIGSTIGKVAQNKSECATNQQINSLIPFDRYSSEFIYSALEYNSTRIASLAGIQAVPIINKSEFSDVSIYVPTSEKEQQKIGSCLSSIDDLITAQTEKIEALKEHKKGLMQQLFPTVHEVIV